MMEGLGTTTVMDNKSLNRQEEEESQPHSPFLSSFLR
jgi:hypothetical protein